jgi:hypothetical protein
VTENTVGSAGSLRHLKHCNASVFTWDKPSRGLIGGGGSSDIGIPKKRPFALRRRSVLVQGRRARPTEEGGRGCCGVQQGPRKESISTNEEGAKRLSAEGKVYRLLDRREGKGGETHWGVRKDGSPEVRPPRMFYFIHPAKSLISSQVSVQDPKYNF